MDDLKFYANGIELPTPMTFDVDSSDVHGSKSGRDENAVMHIDRVRKDVRSVSLTWEYISKEDVKLINDATSDVYFTLSYPYDPITGGRHSITCYRGNRKFTPKLFDVKTQLWGKVTFSAIEV